MELERVSTPKMLCDQLWLSRGRIFSYYLLLQILQELL